MSEQQDDTEAQAGQTQGAEGGPTSDEEYRQAVEEELRKSSVQDIVVQSVVTILNLTSRRIAVDEERDLAQAQLGIDVATAISEHLPEEIKGQVDEALSQLRLQFANQAEAGGSQGSSGEGQQGAGQPASEQQSPGSGQSSGSRLWTPPGSS